MYKNSADPDYIAISQCLLNLNAPTESADLLKQLVKDHSLVAFQISFDLEEDATQDYLEKVLAALPTPSDHLDTAMDTDEDQPEKALLDNFNKIRKILSGQLSIQLYLEFLYRNNHTDLLILKNTKSALDSRNSVFHSAVTFANAFMNAGTTSDEFLRQNLDWLSRATNWTKFSATAALGVLHKVRFSI